MLHDRRWIRCEDCRGTFLEGDGCYCDGDGIVETFRAQSWLWFQPYNDGGPGWARMWMETVQPLPRVVAEGAGVLPSRPAEPGRAAERVQGVPKGATSAASKRSRASETVGTGQEAFPWE